jgi:hypothetical protein
VGIATGHTRRSWWYLCIALLLSLLSAPIAYAVTSGAISQGYETTSSNIGQGALVSLVSTDSNDVEPAGSSNAGTLVGVAANKPVLELSNGTASSIQVVTSGTAEALVSDANGPVNVGDKITASPIEGVGMKALRPGEVVGTAQKSLSAVSTLKQHVISSTGKTVTINVGLLPIAVNVVYYSASSSLGTPSSFVPPFLQALADALTGKQVSPLRVLVGMVALLLGFVAVTVMLYVSIRSGIISIGRNPLAEGVLRRGLVDVIIAAMGVLIVTVVVVYVVLLS